MGEGTTRPANGGRLNSGGNEGNRFGAGRPPSAIRQACRLAFDKRIELLEKIADDEGAKLDDRMKAIDLLGTYGIGKRVDVTSDEQPIKAYLNVDDSQM